MTEVLLCWLLWVDGGVWYWLTVIVYCCDGIIVLLCMCMCGIIIIVIGIIVCIVCSGWLLFGVIRLLCVKIIVLVAIVCY